MRVSFSDAYHVLQCLRKKKTWKHCVLSVEDILSPLSSLSLSLSLSVSLYPSVSLSFLSHSFLLDYDTCPLQSNVRSANPFPSMLSTALLVSNLVSCVFRNRSGAFEVRPVQKGGGQVMS